VVMLLCQVGGKVILYGISSNLGKKGGFSYEMINLRINRDRALFPKGPGNGAQSLIIPEYSAESPAFSPL